MELPSETAGVQSSRHQNQRLDDELEAVYEGLVDALDIESYNDVGLTFNEFRERSGIPDKRLREMLNKGMDEGKVYKGQAYRWSEARGTWVLKPVYCVMEKEGQ